MAHMRDIGAATIEPIEQYEDEWVEHVNEVSKISLRSTCSSWYVGANIPGRPRVFMPYIGGFPVYVQKCNEVMSNGFEGFVHRRRRAAQRSAARAADRALARAARHRGDLARGGRRPARAGGVTTRPSGRASQHSGRRHDRKAGFRLFWSPVSGAMNVAPI